MPSSSPLLKNSPDRGLFPNAMLPKKMTMGWTSSARQADIMIASPLPHLRKYASTFRFKMGCGKRGGTPSHIRCNGLKSFAHGAIMYCMFALPHSLGGFNCGPLKPNYKIVLTGKASMLSGLPYVIADAYLPASKRLLSTTVATTTSQRYVVEMRRGHSGSWSMNVDVYRLNDLQLKDAAALESVARTLYRRKQIQFSPRARAYASKCPELLRELRQAVGLGN